MIPKETIDLIFESCVIEEVIGSYLPDFDIPSTVLSPLSNLRSSLCKERNEVPHFLNKKIRAY